MKKQNSTNLLFAIYKPYGFLSQFINNETTRKNRKLLGDLYSFPKNTMAIGRLDYHSEGLLLLTTDGKISAFIRSNKVEKEYYVQVDGLITDVAIEKLKKGVAINIEGKEYQTKPSIASKLEIIPQLPKRAKDIRSDRHGPTSWISITINEGKFRQIRKMTAVVGFPTLRLVRVRIGKLKIDSLNLDEVTSNIDFKNL